MGGVIDCCNAADMKNESNIQQNFSDADIDVNISKSFVVQIRNTLPAFDYKANAPAPDGVVRTVKSRQTLADKSEYEGEWNAQNLRDGRGIQIWPNGSIYEGYWRNGKTHGKGRLIHADGDVQEGDWVEDKAHGYGSYVHNDGSKYEGGWVNDKQHGKGKEKWPDETRFEGEYVNGKKNG